MDQEPSQLTDADKAILTGLAKKMRFVGIAVVVFASSTFLIDCGTAFMQGYQEGSRGVTAPSDAEILAAKSGRSRWRIFDLPTFSLLFFGVCSYRAGNSFRMATQSSADPMRSILIALSSLHEIYSFLYWSVWVVGVVLVLLTAVVAVQFLLLPFRGGP